VKACRVLLVEDSPEDQRAVCGTLSAKGYSVTTISDPERALNTVGDWAKQYNFVIIQEVMNGHSGMALVHEVRSRRKDLPILVVTRDGDWNGYARALSEGVVDYFQTPVDGKKVVKTVEDSLASTA
jgi:DNA-binding NtrC family response regulator